MSIVEDIILFYKTVGALDELSERGLYKPQELNTIDHKEYLLKLVKKYNVEYETCGGGIEDEILNMEASISEKFKTIMENKL